MEPDMGLTLQFHAQDETRPGYFDNPAAVFQKPVRGISETRQGYSWNPPRVPGPASMLAARLVRAGRAAAASGLIADGRLGARARR
jgi:hypothetical protein